MNIDIQTQVEYDNSKEQLMLRGLKERVIDLLSEGISAIRISVPRAFSGIVSNWIRHHSKSKYLSIENSSGRQQVFVLKKFLTVIKFGTFDQRCVDLRDLESRLKTLRPQFPIKIPFEADFEIRRRIEELVRSLGYEIGYDIDEEKETYVIVIISESLRSNNSITQ